MESFKTKEAGNPKAPIAPFFKVLEDEMEIDQWIILLYGQSGVQKTRLGAQFPKPIIIAAERGEYGGTISAKEFKPSVVKVSTWTECQQVIPKIKAALATGQFYTIVTDSITSVQRMCLKQVLLDVNKEAPTLQEWGLLLERMRTWITQLTELPAHIVFTALEQVTQDANEKTFGGPKLQGGIAFELPAMTDINLHMYAKKEFNPVTKKNEQKLFLESVPTGVFTAKDCSGTLPSVMSYKPNEYAFTHLKHLFEDPTIKKKKE